MTTDNVEFRFYDNIDNEKKTAISTRARPVILRASDQHMSQNSSEVKIKELCKQKTRPKIFLPSHV